jgi:alpha-aminoadipate carrier protein LysW
MAGECPECTEVVNLFTNNRIGEIVMCPGCQAELEIIGLDPPEFALAPEVEEDWGE